MFLSTAIKELTKAKAKYGGSSPSISLRVRMTSYKGSGNAPGNYATYCWDTTLA